MIKLAVLATVTAGLFMGANTAADIPQVKVAPRDTRIIVELDRSLSSLTSEGVTNVQNNLLNHIRSEVTRNIEVVSRYTVLNNAIAIAVNEQYVDQITNLSGVKSVTVDRAHFIKQDTGSVRVIESTANDYGGSDNISAQTMNKPTTGTNDGEGTTIAIIDNEFYLKGKVVEGKTVKSEAWCHETFTSFEELEETVVQRYKPVTDEKGKNRTPAEFRDTKLHAYKSKSLDFEAGEEGSLYFNSKVPFYYDYGGEISTYGSSSQTPDYDVTSKIDYHGSHVASIAAGHAKFYKGIAPKAQLVCMKIATDFTSNTFTDDLGLSSFSAMYEIPILNALEDCITLGVDGINMSLGSALDDFDGDSITMKTITRLEEKGILSAISAGNDGKTSYSSLGGYANWTSEMVETGILGSYANNKSATIIASAQPDKIYYTQALQIGDKLVAYDDQVVNREGLPKEFDDEHYLKDLFKDDPSAKEWVYVPGFGDGPDYEGLKVRGKIAVVNRGSTSFEAKYTTAKAQGAKALIIINNDPTASDFNMRASFGSAKPEFPVAFVLFKDKGIFDGSETGEKSGSFTIASDILVVNEKARTSSDFTSDGISADLEIKPDISSPGDLIRGAIPPQKKEDKEDRPLNTYAFLSGTSMASPNYAGAQSVLLSKYAKDTRAETAVPGAMTEEQLAAYKKTIEMRFLSTAKPMHDQKVSPENGVLTLTSPRIQGAGLVDLGAAYNTDVYLEGSNAVGDHTGKSKISLKNDPDTINKGILDFHFYSHNESDVARTYDAYLTVMRPATKLDNEVVDKTYHNCGEIDSISAWPGRSEYTKKVDQGVVSYVEKVTPGTPNDKDYYVVKREFGYYASAQDIADYDYDQTNGTWSCECGRKHITHEEEIVVDGHIYCPDCHQEKDFCSTDFTTKVEPGKYVYDAASGTWGDLPGYKYQSTQDVYIEEKYPLGEISFAPGEERQDLNSIYTLSAEEKTKILEFFTYGTYIEGYISFESKQGKENLSLVYAGFFAGEGNSYEDAPVFEPFNFEKQAETVYPSDLVNNLATTLIGNKEGDFGSQWIAGYLPQGKGFDYDPYLLNSGKSSLTSLAHDSADWHRIGEDPFSKELYDDTSNNLYVGDPYASNTMIVQQFILRSAADNYFTITNEEDEVVYKGNMIDGMRSYGYMGTWPLYKSHVVGSYLASYTADKAYAVIPLYDTETGEAFPDGKYDITFNYLLAGTNTWVDYTYHLIVDSSSPKISKVTYTEVNDSPDPTITSKVRFDIKEENLAYVFVGGYMLESEKIKFDEETENYYFELNNKELTKALEDNPNLARDGTGRLFISLLDKGYGRDGCIVRFKYNVRQDKYIFNNYIMGQHPDLTLSHDLIDRGEEVAIIVVTGTDYVEETNQDILKFTECVRNGEVIPHIAYEPYVVGGCGGNVATTSVILSTLSLSAIILIAIARKKKKLGGK